MFKFAVKKFCFLLRFLSYILRKTKERREHVVDLKSTQRIFNGTLIKHEKLFL